DHAVLQPLAIGSLASLVTGLVLAGAEWAANSRERKILAGVATVYDQLRIGSDRFVGTWLRAHVSATTSNDPNRFWMVDRFVPEECSKRLVMLGQSHRSVFEDV